MTELEHVHHLRHCMVVYATYPHYETRVQREAEALVSHGHEVDVICPRYSTEESLLDHHCGVTIHRVNMCWERKKSLAGQFRIYLTFFWLTTLKLISLHFRRRYDVIQVHNLPDFLVFVTLLPKMMGARVILDLHDLMPEFYQSRFKPSASHFLHRLVYLQEKLSCRFADRVITVTEPWRQTLIKRGVPAEKCHVVMNLADPRIFRPFSQEEISFKDKNRFCLFYHGDMPERYGLDLVLRAIAQLRHEIPQIHFMLVGGGQFLQTLKQIATELDLDQKQVEFVWGVPAEELHSLMAQADVCVVPYRNDIFTDSLLPTKLLEYAVAELPTIAARTTVISTYFDEGMVLFFEPGNVEDLARCILMLYENPKRRDDLAKGIRRFNTLYNWVDAGNDYVSWVERLCFRSEQLKA